MGHCFNTPLSSHGRESRDQEDLLNCWLRRGEGEREGGGERWGVRDGEWKGGGEREEGHEEGGMRGRLEEFSHLCSLYLPPV